MNEQEERRKAVAKKWRQANKEHLKAKTYEWRLANPERYKDILKRSRVKNLPKLVARNIQRTKRIKRATPPWADRAAIIDLYVLARTLSKASGIAFDVDHIIPLNGQIVCGLHVAGNLRLLPSRENRIKHNRFDEVLL